MKLLEKLKEWSTKDVDFHTEKVLTHQLMPELEKLVQFKSEHDLVRSTVFKALQDEIQNTLFGYEYGCYSDEREAPLKPHYRAVLWHLENGKNDKGILETLRNRALLSRADIYFFPAVDIGMARSGNHNAVRDLAIELGYNYFFVTSYLNLNAIDPDYPEPTPNKLGLEGNAIMTRLPISNLRVIPVHEQTDLMQGRVKKIGCQKALLADLILSENKKITIVCVNLPENTSPGQRARSMKRILHKIKKEGGSHPVLLAGDLKTSAYDTRGPWAFFMSLMNKTYRGLDYIIQEHHTAPEKFFEKKLFDSFHDAGFDYEALNEPGVGTFHSQLQGLLSSRFAGHGPVKLLQKLLKKYDEQFSFKYDWFAGNHCIRASQRHQAERPKVITHLIHDGKPISAHDPVLLDFELVYEMVG